MDIERETVVEAGVSSVAVLVFVAAVVYVSITYGTDGVMDPSGGLAILGAIVLFIVVMTGVGYWLAGRE